MKGRKEEEGTKERKAQHRETEEGFVSFGLEKRMMMIGQKERERACTQCNGA